jgi:DNA-binding transcriptional LysR family regulator
MSIEPASTVAGSRPGSNLTLKDLRHVWFLNQTLSFNRAAELAGISQSALSQSIANIEQRLGVELFDRDRRNVSATLFATLIAEQAESVMNSLEEMGSHIDALRDSREGAVAFGMGIFAANHLLNPVLTRFYELHPEIHLRATVNVVDELENQLLRGDIKFFVAAKYPKFRDATPVREHLYRDELVVALRPDHPLVEQDPISCRELIHYPTVTADGDYLRQKIYQVLTNTEEFELLNRNFPAVRLQQPWSLVDFVEVSDHLILASKSALQHLLNAGRLVAVNVRDLDMGIDVELVYRHAGMSPADHRMVAIVREVIASQQLSQ